LPAQGPEATIRQFFVLLGSRQWAMAYPLLSIRFQTAHPYEEWASGYQTTTSVTVESVAPAEPANAWAVRFVALDPAITGPAPVRWSGTWTMVQEGGAWRLDVGQFAREATPAPLPGAAPLEVTRAYYAALTARDFPRAWQFLSSEYQRTYPYARWAGDFNALPVVNLERVDPGGAPDTVIASVGATARTPSGTTPRRWVTDWTLVEEGGGWKLREGIQR
jgi:hypothetical protein